MYKQVFDRLNEALDPTTRHALNVAAVLGHRLNDLSLYAIGDLGPGQVMSAMSELVAHRILRDSGRGLEFVNEFVRAVAYLEVPSTVRRALHASVAERLIEEERRGTRFLGLEIAWHAARGGRLNEVPIYLLRGAKDAISEGALDAASKALGTALSQLAPPDQTAAALLLTEVLQEQGRWAESLTALMSDGEAQTSADGTVFRILAEHRITGLTRDQMRQDIERLLLIAESGGSSQLRLKAANAATQFMTDTRDQTISETLLKTVSTLGPHGFTEEENRQLMLCRAQLLYHSGQQRAAFELLKDLAISLKARGIANSTLVRVHTGLGAVQCFEGRYEAARVEFDTGYSIAARIGNESQQAGLAAQLALCYLRLGEYDLQSEWNTRAVASSHQGAGYQDLQTAYYQAFALAMQGEPKSALHAFARVDSRIQPESPLWLIQAWQLFRADILCLCGQGTAAVAQAKEALSFPQPVLRASSFAGSFARWLALVASREGRPESARPILDPLWSELDRFDALDRAEITCARILLGMWDEAEDLQRVLAKRIGDLPPATAAQLERLGVLKGTLF